MRTCIRYGAFCSAAVLTAACSGDQDRRITVERVDSAGLEIVTSPGDEHALDWQIEEVLTIDSEGTGAGVFEPFSAGVATDDTGRIFALDRRGSRVVVFDAAGRFVHSLGRKGGGPGEFDFPLALIVAPDGRAAVYDGAKRRLVWFARDGSVLPERDLGEPFFGGYMRQTEAGLLYDRRRAGGDQPAMSGIALTTGDSAVTLAERPDAPTKSIQLASCGMGFSGMPRVFEPSIRWDARGSLMAAATGASYEISVFDGGRELRRVRRAVGPRAATAELAAQEIGDGMRVGTQSGERVCRTDEVVEQRGFAEVIPAIGRIALDPAGRVWVQRGGVRGEDRPIDVFSPDGGYLGTLPAATPFPSAFLPDDRFATVISDELDVTRIAIMRFRVPGVSAEERM